MAARILTTPEADGIARKAAVQYVVIPSESARFLIASQLYRQGTVATPFLHRQTGLSWGNLGSHLTRLEKAGYLVTQRGVRGNRRRTTLNLTEKGRAAFEAYRRQIEAGLAQLSESGPSIPGARTGRAAESRPNRRRSIAALTVTPAGAGPALAGVLGKSPLFSDLSRKQLDELSRIAASGQVRSRDYIFLEGDPLDSFYIVVTGIVKSLIHSPTGKDFIIGFYGPGETLGNMDLLSGRPHAFSAQAASDTILLTIKSGDFMSFVYGYPDLALKIFREMLVVIRARHANKCSSSGTTGFTSSPWSAGNMPSDWPQAPRT